MPVTLFGAPSLHIPKRLRRAVLFEAANGHCARTVISNKGIKQLHVVQALPSTSHAGDSAPDTVNPFLSRGNGNEAQSRSNGSTSTSSSSQQNWDYKYKRHPCASPCPPGDLRCLKLEALFQNVLCYPRMPPRVFRYLPNVATDINTITDTVERLSERYGSELTLYFVRRAPFLLQYDFETIQARAEHARQMLDLRPAEVFMLLRKNPNLLCMDPVEVRSRLNGLHRVTPLSFDAAKRMAKKFPMILNHTTETVSNTVDALRQISYSRVIWQENFAEITPSLLAFFYRDAKDQLLRLEYLSLTGEWASHSLKEIFKLSNNLFHKRHRGFRPWLRMREEQRRQQLQKAEAHQAARAALFTKQADTDQYSQYMPRSSSAKGWRQQQQQQQYPGQQQQQQQQSRQRTQQQDQDEDEDYGNFDDFHDEDEDEEMQWPKAPGRKGPMGQLHSQQEPRQYKHVRRYRNGREQGQSSY